jgi:hypothetical protein
MKGLRNVAGIVIPVVALGLLLLPVAARAGEKDDEALKNLDAAKLTLTKAIQAAETESKGKAIAAHVKVEGAGGQVIVFCEVGGKCMEVPVDIKTGKAAKATEANAKDEKGDHLTKPAEIVKLLSAGNQTLAKIVEAAEASASATGKAISIKPKLSGDKLDYIVKVKAADKWENVTVDGKTGKVTKSAEKGDKKTDKKDEKKTEKKPAEPKKH